MFKFGRCRLLVHTQRMDYEGDPKKLLDNHPVERRLEEAGCLGDVEQVRSEALEMESSRKIWNWRYIGCCRRQSIDHYLQGPKYGNSIFLGIYYH